MSSPLLEKLESYWGYDTVNESNWQALTQSKTVCLFFSSDPKRFPEANDVAVVLPELVGHFSGEFEPLLVDQSFELQLQKHFGFRRWPALVFVRNGKMLGFIEKIQDWSDYLKLIPELLEQGESETPLDGIPLVTLPNG